MVVVIVFLFKNRLFVTPEQLEKRSAAILKEVEERFVTLLQYSEFKAFVSTRFDEGARRFDHLDKGIDDIKNCLVHLAEKE